MVQHFWNYQQLSKTENAEYGNYKALKEVWNSLWSQRKIKSTPKITNLNNGFTLGKDNEVLSVCHLLY